jgi:hypothetical protein
LVCFLAFWDFAIFILGFGLTGEREFVGRSTLISGEKKGRAERRSYDNNTDPLVVLCQPLLHASTSQKDVEAAAFSTLDFADFFRWARVATFRIQIYL